MYKENPKTKGSGIICCIPQTGICPNKCEDCFFQSGRSYLEPLKDNLPNIPEIIKPWHIVRINDGHDSNIMPKGISICNSTKHYPLKFYNTAIPKNLDDFDAPVVLTINPGNMTDNDFHRTYSKKIMFVRARTNTWNFSMIRCAVQYYSDREVPIVLTFMAYFDTANKIPKEHQEFYQFRKRTLNSYYAITTDAWENVMAEFKYNKWVSSCGKIEGEKGTTVCRFCGNCLREYFATMERLNK